MARISIESAKSIIGTLLNEQERDRDNLQRMLSHSQKMSEALALMRDQEEHRIDTEAAERKANLRRLFGQLLAVEDEARKGWRSRSRKSRAIPRRPTRPLAEPRTSSLHRDPHFPSATSSITEANRMSLPFP